MVQQKQLQTKNSAVISNSTAHSSSEKFLTDSERAEAKKYLDIARVKAAQGNLLQYFAVEFHRNTLNQPMQFHNDPWLVDIYNMINDQEIYAICIMKGVQCGGSECVIIYALVECFTGRSVIYVLPSKTFKSDFMAKRIDGLFDKVPFYKNGVGATDNKGIKSMWTGYLKFVGSNVEADFASDPAQVAIIDEVDLCHQKNLAMVDNRLAATFKLTGKKPRRINISNPTIEGYGISKMYDESNMMEWHITCDCGKEQPLDWFKNFVEQTDGNRYNLRDKDWTESSKRDIRGYCCECGKEINRLADGRWIAQFPERRKYGIHISQLFTGQVSIRKVWEAFQAGLKDTVELQVFYNAILGLPFTNAGFMITPALLASCVDPEHKLPETATGCVAGVDIGKDVHITISQIKDKKRYKVHVNHIPLTDNFETELIFILKAYGVKVCVIDAMPETGLVRKFQKFARQHGVVVFLCRFQMGVSIKEIKADSKTGEVTPDRTQAFDACFDSYRSGEVVLPEDWRSLGHNDYQFQMCKNVRVLHEDDKGNKRYIWSAGTKQADHYHLADIYELLAAQICGFDTGPKEIYWL